MEYLHLQQELRQVTHYLALAFYFQVVLQLLQTLTLVFQLVQQSSKLMIGMTISIFNYQLVLYSGKRLLKNQAQVDTQLQETVLMMNFML